MFLHTVSILEEGAFHSRGVPLLYSGVSFLEQFEISWVVLPSILHMFSSVVFHKKEKGV
ncbi:hypothetical protein N781_00095 [Pontibacillus halophilus JSM 076056 = DSM 19796]|uniref:Uncharacterized protein n=1 Tax=Pontibacillus halophilus JSM 076056 = DSM 19796 TaxID=1385510 RepID=A0A0A5GSD3_9BACI|nr:hypothetical protein N781_00095 [Pontibacillus halophilus JSM 076056 = DSM 19796]